MYNSTFDAAYETSKKNLEAKGFTFQTIEESRKNPVTLRRYGKSWTPSDGEEFYIKDGASIVNVPYTKRNGDAGRLPHIHMWSSKTGWDLYPVTPFGYAPDVKEELDQLQTTPVSRQLTTRCDDDDRADILIQVKHFTVHVLTLHGPTWERKEDGTLTRIPDSIDKPTRPSFDYYQVIPITE